MVQQFLYGASIILSLVSFVCLMLGLATPKTFNWLLRKQAKRKDILLVFGLAMVVFIILITMTTPGVSLKNSVSGLSSFLAVISLICLIAGLIKPTFFKGFVKGEINKKKIALIFGIPIVVFAVLAQVINPTQTINPTPTQTKQTAPNPPVKISEQDQIKKIISNELKGNNNDNKPYIRDITFSQQADGANLVIIDYNADENLTNNMTKQGIEMEMSKIYEDLYKNNTHNIALVDITAYLPMIDKYGNTTDEPVYISQLASDEALKINWSEDSSLLELDTIPGVWKTIFLSPSFQ